MPDPHEKPDHFKQKLLLMEPPDSVGAMDLCQAYIVHISLKTTHSNN